MIEVEFVFKHYLVKKRESWKSIKRHIRSLMALLENLQCRVQADTHSSLTHQTRIISKAVYCARSRIKSFVTTNVKRTYNGRAAAAGRRCNRTKREKLNGYTMTIRPEGTRRDSQRDMNHSSPGGVLPHRQKSIRNSAILITSLQELVRNGKGGSTRLYCTYRILLSSLATSLLCLQHHRRHHGRHHRRAYQYTLCLQPEAPAFPNAETTRRDNVRATCRRIAA